MIQKGNKSKSARQQQAADVPKNGFSSSDEGSSSSDEDDDLVLEGELRKGKIVCMYNNL